MLNPITCTIADATEYAQTLKQSFDTAQDKPIVLQASEQQFLVGFLKLAHPRGGIIDPDTAEITIARKPLNCDRPGLSQTCYYLRPSDNAAQFHPVWFADCRKAHRSKRLQENRESVAA